MKLKKKIILGVLAFASAFFFAVNVHAARTDMIDVSGNNTTLSQSDFTSIRNNYGVKAVTVKISEGSTYAWSGAKSAITNATNAGLYVNGYHYAHFSTLAKAQEEANFAVAQAKADGLGIGAVLAVDVESSAFESNSVATNDANVAAFNAIVQAAGYRTDIYTSASWIGEYLSIPDSTGWIAAYPKLVSTDRYTSSHAWQFSSKMSFSGISGYFDVSQFYDTYYTANLTSTISNSDTTNVSKVTKKAVTTTSSVSGTFKDGSYTITRQNGTFYPNQTLRIFKYPGSQATGKYYYKGEHVTYDGYVHVGNYIYISYKTATGYHHYIAVRYAPTRRALGIFK